MSRPGFQHVLFSVCVMSAIGCQSQVGSLGTATEKTNDPIPTNPENPTTPPAPPPTPPTPEVFTPSVRLGDRNYVSSFLTTLFVPTSVPGTETSEANSLRASISSLVTEQYAIFGGACDFYESSSTNCPLASTEASALTAPSPIRAAYSSRVVYQLLTSTGNEVGLKSAYSRTQDVAYSSVTLAALNNAAPTGENLRRIFEYIHPGKTMTEASLQKALDFVNSMAISRGNREAWRFAFILFLSDLSWQSL